MMTLRNAALLSVLLSGGTAHAFFEDIGPLLQLVSGQVTELQKLAEEVNVAKDSQKTLLALNEGINQTVGQIQSIQALLERAQGLDPTAVRSLSDLNDLLYRANDVQLRIDDLLLMKVGFANQAIDSSSLQSDTAYRMGAEMTVVGSGLAQESQSASPGRAAQITAASSSAQMLAKGVELQTMAQLIQLQALSLDFQKAQVERDLQDKKARNQLFEQQLGKPKKGNLP